MQKEQHLAGEQPMVFLQRFCFDLAALVYLLP